MVPMDRGRRVVVVGGINQDVVVHAAARPGPGETVVGDGPSLVPGGKGANTAAAAARAGATVSMCGAVGPDAAGVEQLDALRAAGVEVDHVAVRDDAATGVALIVVTPDGENSIVVGRGANDHLEPDAVRRSCADAAVVLAQTEVGAGPADAAAAAAAACRGRFVLSLAPVVGLAPATLAAADPVVLNEQEAAELVGRADPDPAGAALAAAGCRSAVVSLGARGAAWADAEGRSGLVPSVPVGAADVVDTTGAGDALCGTLAAALAAGADLPDAVAAGCAAAAAVVQHPGARPPRADRG